MQSKYSDVNVLIAIFSVNFEFMIILLKTKIVFVLGIFSTVEVLATLTSDVGRILSKMHLVQPKGNINFITGVRIAHVSVD